MSEISEREFRRNYALLATEEVAFGIGMSFLGPGTILPSLVHLLGGSQVAVGALTVIQSGGWILPQLFMGRYVANRPLVKRYVLAPSIASRAILGLAVPVLALYGAREPRLALTALMLLLAGFCLADGMGGAGWFDLLAKTIPIERRGRSLGVAQSLSSLAGIGVGVVVRLILARSDPFPANYVLLIALAVASYSICPVALGLLREPVGTVAGQAQPPWREYLPRLATILRHDRRFVWLVVTSCVAALADTGGVFYVLFAGERLSMPQAMIGLFISSQVVGGLVSGLILGPLGDRKGSASVIGVTMALRCLCPLLALLAPWMAGLQPWLGPGVFMLIFAALGVINGAYMIGFLNYVLEIAPAGERPTYIGLSQTLGAVVLFAPLLAGWLVEVASYEALFVATLGLATAGLGLALRRPERAVQPGVQQAGG